MKSLVCISHVPDTTTVIKYDAEGKSLDKTGVTFVINPYDEYGLVRAIEFKEQTGQGEVTVLCVGGAEVEPTLRRALAIGADKAVRIDSSPLDGMYVASQIAAYAKDKGFDFIFLGKESIDHNGGEVPGMLAEMLGMPLVVSATHLEMDGSTAKLKREMPGGYESIETSLPAVVSCTKGISEWRIPNMRGIMSARTKPLEVVAASDASAAVETVKLELPPPKEGCHYFEVDEVDKLVEVLHEKGFV